jgi:pimeloyl-ACP methyl ester carboxylesterase
MKKYFLFLIKLIFIFLLFLSCSSEKADLTVISVNDVKINYNVTGDGEPALVFIHGWSCDSDYWRYQVDNFKDRFTVVTIDLAGHGESGLNRTHYSMKAFGEDVKAVIKELNIKKAILIGHSMGGAVIIEAARLMPEEIIGLVGTDTFQNFEIKISDEQITNYLKTFEKNFKETSDGFVRNMFTENADSLLVNEIVEDMSSAPPNVAISAMNEYFHYNYPESLKDIMIPIICINSDKWETNISAGKKYAKSFDVKMMKGIGHFVMLENPDLFNRLLDETITDLSN